MTAKLLSEKVISVINQYKNFTTGFAVCNIPYYNNRRDRIRAGLRVHLGKGSPTEIMEEAGSIAILNKINLKALDSISLKKFLVDNNIGIDCSGFAYHVLRAEMEGRGKGRLKLSFPFAKGPYAMLRALFRPVENAGVATLAHDKNSRAVELRFAEPGDMITMLGGPEGGERDHVLIIHEVDYKDDVIVAINYTHAIAWPTDGEYGHGVRSGQIRVTDPTKSITEQEWIESEMRDEHNYTYARAAKSQTEIRRLSGL